MSPVLFRLLRASLDDGEPFHDAIALLRRESEGSIQFIRALRELTGVSLQHAVRIKVQLDNGDRLAGDGWTPVQRLKQASQVPWELHFWLTNAVLDGHAYAWIESREGGVGVSSSAGRPTALAPSCGSSPRSMDEVRAALAELPDDTLVRLVEDTGDHIILHFPTPEADTAR